MPVEREELKISERESGILGAVLWSTVEEISSKSEVVSIGAWEIRQQIPSG